MKYPEYKSLNLASVAQEILKFWQDHKIFEKSVDQRSSATQFTFYEGPPSANGTPGIHHVMGRTIKDLFCRYKTLKGFQVERKGGWDTHGLPVELQVEKQLGITKEDIGKSISVEEYNQKCREAVMKFKDQWDDLTQKMGYWVDLENPYVTFEKEYIESVWSLLKQFFDRDLLYKGYTVQPYSPAAGTGLSSHELNLPGCYRDVKDTSITAQFKVKRNERSEFLFDQSNDEVFILAWTTTPWTLPSNCALAIGEKIDYVSVTTFNPYTYKPEKVVLAKDLVSKFFNQKGAEAPLDEYSPGDKVIPWKVDQEFKGTQLLEIRYEQLMPYVTNEELQEKAFRVIPGDFVTTADGTGVVHTASVFGADDYRVTQQYGVPPILAEDEEGNQIPLVDKQGRFVKEVTDFAGRFVKAEYESDEVRNDPDYKSTDVLIAIKLKEKNKAFKVEKYVHSYPHCWRTDKPVLYYPLDSWFIRTTALKDRLMKLNDTINWKPASTGTGRFGNWLANLVDWNLSRSRFWGTPLPIWMTEDGKEMVCIGSIDQLKAEVKKAVQAGLMDKELSDDFDPHRPYVDDIILISESGQKMKREPDLIDVWFDSGAMPYAQWHYPFENKGQFEKQFPADFIAEGVDQTRGWFFTLHAIAGLLFDQVAFKNVVSNGLVLDKNGNKMSKRHGNAVDPFSTLEKYGADAVRWYMISNANPWDNLKFDIDGIVEVQRRFFGTLHNTYSFFALYANLDGFDFSEAAIPIQERTESDQWILSRLNSVIKETDEAYDNYEPTKGARVIQDFVIEDLSNWYVRLNRKRFWKGEYNDDKRAAYQTLYTCLETIAGLMAPIAPFYGDLLFRNLNSVSKKNGAIESVHLSDFPTASQEMIASSLEDKMCKAQDISSLVHSLRKKDRLKVRQPLSRILIPVLEEEAKHQISAVEDIILNEVNVKRIEYIDDTSGVLVKKIKPNFKKLGAEYGKKLKQISQQINAMTADDIRIFEKDGKWTVQADDESIDLTLEDVEIISEDIPGWSVASNGKLTVALDITVTDDLRKEGIARDFVNRIQNLRKDKGFEVQDKIAVHVKENEPLVNDALIDFQSYICEETQATNLDIVQALSNEEILEIDDLKLAVTVEKMT